MPDGTTTIPHVWHDFKEMTARAEELDIEKTVADGCVADLDEDVMDAYRAPFPTDDHKTGAHALPSRVPIEPDMAGADVIGDVREAFADWKCVFALFSGVDPITRSARKDLLSVFPTADE